MEHSELIIPNFPELEIFLCLKVGYQAPNVNFNLKITDDLGGALDIMRMSLFDVVFCRRKSGCMSWQRNRFFFSLFVLYIFFS